MSHISYGKQSIKGKDIKAVSRLLRTDWITQGPEVGKFEKALAEYCGARFAVVVSSGTAALHIASLAAGLGRGDEAITTPITFLATSNAILYTGAKPVFADVDYETINIDPDDIIKKITGKTKAVLPVHFAGLPCDMPVINNIAKKKGLKVIEDACHALGAEYKHNGKWIKTGSCKHSDMAIFSFHPVKHITTGEGGAVTTNSKKLYKKLCALRTHGIYKDKKMRAEKGPWYYEMRDLGFNYRLTDFQCALGLSQLESIRGFLKKRREIARSYDEAFSNEKFIEIPFIDPGKKHAYHLYPIKIDFRGLGLNRKSFFKRLQEHGIFPQVHYIPVYKQPYYIKNFKISGKKWINSERYYDRAVSIPIYPKMTTKDVKKVIAVIKKTLKT